MFCVEGTEPKLDAKIDLTNLTKLMIAFDLAVTSNSHVDALNELEHKPMRYRFSYKYLSADNESTSYYDAESE